MQDKNGGLIKVGDTLINGFLTVKVTEVSDTDVTLEWVIAYTF
jgi:hypothetical protein